MVCTIETKILNLIINRISGYLSINNFFEFLFEKGTKEGVSFLSPVWEENFQTVTSFFSERNAFSVRYQP
ncbi:hypothetical protein VT99_13101, partial [Candidatus Electrothrix marina]